MSVVVMTAVEWERETGLSEQSVHGEWTQHSRQDVAHHYHHELALLFAFAATSPCS